MSPTEAIARTPSAAILRGLRRAGDEPQLTRALAATFQADPQMGAQFVELVLAALAPHRRLSLPSHLECSTEELVEAGRPDLRFRADGWDVIVELKIYASYGRDQLDRYLSVLEDVDGAFLTAITRSVPRYGEPSADGDARWLGSVQWRRLLPGLRGMRSADEQLNSQWPVFLGVLEEEGSMGFTQPKPDLFRVFAQLRETRLHTDEFVEALQMPLLEALVKALGGDSQAASIYKTTGGKMHVARSWNAITDSIFLVPADGAQRIRAGLFAYNPPVRFYVAPKNGRTWVARLAKLPPEAQESVKFLFARDFRNHDLHAFLELDETLLLGPSLEEDIVEWAHARFVDIAQSGLLTHTVEPAAPEGSDDELEELE